MGIIDFLRSLLCPDAVTLTKKVDELNTLNQELEIRVAMLTNALEDSFVVVSADDCVDVDDATEIHPYSSSVLKKYDLTVADFSYYCFPKTQWEKLLSEIQPFLTSLIGEWTENVADCDDFSLIMNAFVAASFIRGGCDLQGAFFIAHSQTHAYNVFVDDTKKVWVYEPQNNKVVGLIGNTSKPYDTKKILCVGTSLRPSMKRREISNDS